MSASSVLQDLSVPPSLLAHLYKQDSSKNVKIQTMDGTFVWAHDVILAAISPRLKNIISMQEERPFRIDTPTVSERTWYIILEFFYLGTAYAPDGFDIKRLRATLDNLGMKAFVDYLDEALPTEGDDEFIAYVPTLIRAIKREEGDREEVVSLDDSDTEDLNNNNVALNNTKDVDNSMGEELDVGSSEGLNNDIDEIENSEVLEEMEENDDDEDDMEMPHLEIQTVTGSIQENVHGPPVMEKIQKLKQVSTKIQASASSSGPSDVQISRKGLNCPECDGTYSNINGLITHMGKMHSILTKEFANLQCKYCDLSFETLNDIAKHYRAVHLMKDGFQCKFCTSTFASTSSLRKHFFESCKQKPPELKDKKGVKVLDMKKNYAKYHLPADNLKQKEPSSRPAKSNAASASTCVLNNDEITAVSTNNGKKRNSRLTNVVTIEGPGTSKSSSRKVTITSSPKVVSSDNTSTDEQECHICHRQFPSWLSLRSHIGSAHTRKKNSQKCAETMHECLVCHRFYANMGSVRSHMKLVHGDTLKNKSQRKGLRSTGKQPSEKTLNPSEETKETPPSIQCTHCNRFFATLRGMGIHRMQVHKVRGSTKIHACPHISVNLPSAKPTPAHKEDMEPLPQVEETASSSEENAGSPNEKPSEDENQMVPCVLCNIYFVSSKALSAHNAQEHSVSKNSAVIGNEFEEIDESMSDQEINTDVGQGSTEKSMENSNDMQTFSQSNDLIIESLNTLNAHEDGMPVETVTSSSEYQDDDPMETSSLVDTSSLENNPDVSHPNEAQSASDASNAGIADERQDRNATDSVLNMNESGIAEKRQTENTDNSEMYSCDLCDQIFVTPKAIGPHKYQAHFKKNKNPRTASKFQTDDSNESSSTLGSPSRPPSPQQNLEQSPQRIGMMSSPSSTSSISAYRYEKRGESSTGSSSGYHSDESEYMESLSSPEVSPERELPKDAESDELNVTLSGADDEENLDDEVDMEATCELYSCDLCEKSFVSVRGLATHTQWHNWNQTRQKPRVFYCEKCDRSFTSSQGLSSHTTRMHKKTKVNKERIEALDSDGTESSGDMDISVEPSTSGSRSLDRNTQEKYLSEENKQYKCSECKSYFNDMRGLIVHSGRKHAPHVSLADIAIFKCNVCKKIFKKACSMSQHQRRYHKITHGYQCRFCSALFECGTSLRYHYMKTCKKRPAKQITSVNQKKERKVSKSKNDADESNPDKNRKGGKVSGKFSTPKNQEEPKRRKLKPKFSEENSARMAIDLECALCDFVAQSARAIGLHLEIFHSLTNCYNCKICCKSFMNYNSFCSHLSNTHRK